MKAISQKAVKRILLAELNQLLASGGVLRLTWGKWESQIEAINANGQSFLVDGRTYHAITRKHPELVQTETGSTDTNDLIMEWRYAKG